MPYGGHADVEAGLLPRRQRGRPGRPGLGCIGAALALASAAALIVVTVMPLDNADQPEADVVLASGEPDCRTVPAYQPRFAARRSLPDANFSQGDWLEVSGCSLIGDTVQALMHGNPRRPHTGATRSFLV